jgi:hypothetical protein
MFDQMLYKAVYFNVGIFIISSAYRGIPRSLIASPHFFLLYCSAGGTRWNVHGGPCRYPMFHHKSKYTIHLVQTKICSTRITFLFIFCIICVISFLWISWIALWQNIPPRAPSRTPRLNNIQIYRDILLLNHRHQGTVLLEMSNIYSCDIPPRVWGREARHNTAIH